MSKDILEFILYGCRIESIRKLKFWCIFVVFGHFTDLYSLTSLDRSHGEIEG